jgi:hypothetical protein
METTTVTIRRGGFTALVPESGEIVPFQGESIPEVCHAERKGNTARVVFRSTTRIFDSPVREPFAGMGSWEKAYSEFTAKAGPVRLDAFREFIALMFPVQYRKWCDRESLFEQSGRAPSLSELIEIGREMEGISEDYAACRNLRAAIMAEATSIRRRMELDGDARSEELASLRDGMKELERHLREVYREERNLSRGAWDALDGLQLRKV